VTAAALSSVIASPALADGYKPPYSPLLGDGPQVDPITVWEEMAKAWVGLPSANEVQGANASAGGVLTIQISRRATRSRLSGRPFWGIRNIWGSGALQ
jgi:hypothetical protein